ncbi:amidase domain-containing protein [Tumebacillus avium]|uniref:amidase domain-containing protein n=1 Tax=Tumebacillus avium TaxID=1903704 RepID=UPI0012FD8F70|nr:amidase domain-containing protein [Tumebacillus avium]
MTIKKISAVVFQTTVAFGLLTGGVQAANPNAGKVLTSEIRTESIVFLPVPEGDMKTVKVNALRKYEKAIGLVKQYFEDQNVSVQMEIDDPEFQQLLKSAGTAFDYFSAEDMKEVVNFVSFMDLYENYAQNDVILKYKNKLVKEGKLSNEEKETLRGLMPIAKDVPSTVNGTNPNAFEVSPLATNGYDRFAARDYARQWASNSVILRNNAVFGYYSTKNNCFACWNDCTNFVSQALYNGGMKFYYGSNYQSASSWSYSDIVPSYTWGGAHNFYLHWKGRAGVAAYTSDLQTGDVVNADFAGDGAIDHTAIITYQDTNLWLTQHTDDKKEVTNVGHWYSSGYSVYGYEMDKASN